jgi:signal peptidase I
MHESSHKKIRLIALGQSLVIPGWGQILLGKKIQAFTFQAILLSVGHGLCWTRQALNSDIFLMLISLVAGIHVLSAASSYRCPVGDKIRSVRLSLLMVLFPIVFLGIALTSYYNREEWLGIGLYHVPTRSMTPSIQPGDIVIVDTWAYRQTPAEIGDVVLFEKPGTDNNLLIKRVEKITGNTGGQERTRLFLTGDNANFSSDSRHFGWVDITSLRGRVRQILLNYSVRGIEFSRRGAIGQRSPSSQYNQ